MKNKGFNTELVKLLAETSVITLRVIRGVADTLTSIATLKIGKKPTNPTVPFQAVGLENKKEEESENMSANTIVLHGNTTKKGALLLNLKNEREEIYNVAYVTLAVKRRYPSKSKTPGGEKTEKTDYFRLRFLNGSAKNIAEYLKEGTSRRLFVEGVLVMEESSVKYVYVTDASGKSVKCPTSVAHIIYEPVIEVGFWEFLDPRPVADVVVKNNGQPESGFSIDFSKVNPKDSKAVTIVSDDMPEIPPFEPEEFNPANF